MTWEMPGYRSEIHRKNLGTLNSCMLASRILEQDNEEEAYPMMAPDCVEEGFEWGYRKEKAAKEGGASERAALKEICDRARKRRAESKGDQLTISQATS